MVEGEKLDDIVDMAKEELRKIAGEKRLGILSGKAQILKVFEASKVSFKVSKYCLEKERSRVFSNIRNNKSIPRC